MIVYTNTNLEQMLDTLYGQFTEKYDMIIGMKRGGLVPAVYISHKLNVPMVVADITHDKSRGDNKDWHEDVMPALNASYKRILIVDDILDSGYTIKDCVKQYKTVYQYSIGVDVAVLVKKDHSCDSDADNVYHAVTIPFDAPFVYFPWETKPELKNEY